MKAFFAKIWAWVLAHKVVAICIAAGTALVIATAVAVPVGVSSAKKKKAQQETQQPDNTPSSGDQGGQQGGEQSGGDQGGQQGGGEQVLPDAPTDSISLVLPNFKFDEALPEPSINGLTAENIETTFTYLNGETSAEIGSYVVGATGTIIPGNYKLRASVSSSTYKPFSLTTEFTVALAEFDEKYAISTDSLNLGVTQSNYDINAVNLNELLAINVVATSAALEGTSFAWKQDYSSFISGTPFDAVVVASKTHYVAKEYTVHVSSTKAAIAVPKLHKPGNAADNFALDYTYTGAAQTVEYVDFDSANVEVVAASVLEATNAATYNVEFKLKNPNRCTWSDSTTANKSFDWTINPASMATLDMNMPDYDYDAIMPTPVSLNVPAGTTITYQYAPSAHEDQKEEYTPGVVNNIIPGTYVMFATYTNTNYETAVKSYGFVVITAQFDAAYALSTTTIDIGEMDPFFNEAAIDLGALLSIKVVATDSVYVGVSFTFESTPHFEDDNPSQVNVVASKFGFENKTYEITVLHTRKRIAKPTLALMNDNPYTETSFYYDGTQKQVKLAGFDSEVMRIIDTPVYTGYDAAEMCIKVGLKDVFHSCWEDGTNDTLFLIWKINAQNVCGASEGYQLVYGTNQTGSSTTPTLNAIDYTGPMALEFQLQSQVTHLYEKFEYGKFTVITGEEYAEINSDDELVLKGLGNFDIKVTSSNNNYVVGNKLGQTYSFTVNSSSRTLKFTSGLATACTASFFGADTTNLVAGNYGESFGGYGDDYVVKSDGAGAFRTDRRFKTIDKVIIHVDPDSITSTHSLSIKASYACEYIGAEGDIQINHNFEAPYDDTLGMVYDFTGKTFNNAKDYYVMFWITSGMKITSIEIQYTVS